MADASPAVVARWHDRTANELASARTMASLADRVRDVLGDHGVVVALRAAARDETRHAGLCAAVVTKLGGTPPGSGDQQTLPPTAAADPVAALAEHVVFLLCAGEHLAGAVLEAQALDTVDVDVADTLRALAKDESHHGSLGWVVLDALLPHVTEAARAELPRQASVQALRALLAYGAQTATDAEDAAAWGAGGTGLAKVVRSAFGRDVVPGLAARGLWAPPGPAVQPNRGM